MNAETLLTLKDELSPMLLQHERGKPGQNIPRRVAESMLQWGRVLMNAETLTFCFPGRPGRMLQWGRRSHERGNLEEGIVSGVREMGPRSHERGNAWATLSLG